MKPEFTNNKPAHDYKGAHCKLDLDKYTRLGEIVEVFWTPLVEDWVCQVKYFNGQTWPSCPKLRDLEILERFYNDEHKIYSTYDSYKCPFTGARESKLVWYWFDTDCEEPIGPFDTEEEAKKDYETIRN